MSNWNPLLLIADIREAMEKVERYAGHLSYDEFIADEKSASHLRRDSKQ